MNLLSCLILGLMMTVSNAALDVEKTVQNVQILLQENALLPRLTREEILSLLNDIRAEDAKSLSTTKPVLKETITTTPYNTIENEIGPVTRLLLEGNVLVKDKSPVTTSAPKLSKTTTKKNEPTLMVVLPYTPRDGSSLQELYTRPPRVERVPVSNTTPKPLQSFNSDNLEEILKHNSKMANNHNVEFPADLQAFLDAHGLTGKPGEDHFLLPLEGFKPLPPAPVIDGKVQLPENILLTYDLIAPSTDKNLLNHNEAQIQALSSNHFLYQPLRPELPFELDTSSSDIKKQTYPFNLPKSRKAKSAGRIPTPNYEPIDYDSFRVIPLSKGINPVKATKSSPANEQNKRQINNTDNETITETPNTLETTTFFDLPVNISTFDALLLPTADGEGSEASTQDETSTDDADAEFPTGPDDAESIGDSDAEFPTGSADAESLIGGAGSEASVPLTNNTKSAPPIDTVSGATIADLVDSFGGAAPEQPGDSELPPPRKNGFYWMLDWNSFLEVGVGDSKVNIRFEPKLGDHQMFLPVNVP